MARSTRWQPAGILLGIILHVLSVHAQSGDGGDVDGFSNTNLGAAGTGAEGSSSSSANLSRGAIIAIAVVVALVVIGGGKLNPPQHLCVTLTKYLVTLAVLFYLAKKRQWQIRKTIRRTATKAVRAMTPRTPAKMNFGPLSPRADKRSHTVTKSPNKEQRDRDVEKGSASTETPVKVPSQETSTTPRGSPERLLSSAPARTRPSQADTESLKSPLWHNFFGRN